MGAFLAAVALASIGGMYALGNVFKEFQPGSNKIQKDIDGLIQQLGDAQENLVPWTKKEMEMLSINITDAVFKKRMTKSGRGVITSIYHEPMVLFAFKTYLSPNRNEIYFIKTSHIEFFYRVRAKHVEVFLNRKKVGLIKNRWEIFDARGRERLGFIDHTNPDDFMPVIVLGEERGRILRVDRADRPNERAFTFLEDMDQSTEAVFLSLTLFELISNRVNKSM